MKFSLRQLNHCSDDPEIKSIRYHDIRFFGRSIENSIHGPVKNEPMRISSSATQKELPLSFLGRGEVRNFHFRQIAKSAAGYLYKVTTPDGLIHYEVFRRTENHRFNYISYPKSNSFGGWAWTTKNLGSALQRFKNL